MKRVVAERNIVLVLFVLVLITFSFAQRDTKKFQQLYNNDKGNHRKLALKTLAVDSLAD